MIGKNEKRFYWFCLALAIYIVIGFKAVPALVHDQLVKNLDNTLTLKTNIKKVEFNPFTFNTKIHNFTLGDMKNPTVSFKEFELDIGVLKSIFELHVNVEKVRLNGAFIDVIQQKDDSINLAKLVKPTNEPKKEEKKSNEPSKVKFLVSQLHLEDANINFTKQKEDQNFKLHLKNINYDLYDLGTYKNILSSNTFTLDINDSSKLGIYGAFNLQPFKLYGIANIENLKLEELAAYKKEMLNFQLDKNATFDLNLNYNVDTTKDLEVLLESTLLKLTNINLHQNKTSPVKLDSLNVGAFKLDLAKQKVVLDDITLSNPSLNVIKSKDSINLANLVKQDNKAKVEEKKVEPETKASKPWNVSVNNLNINKTNLLFKDQVASTTIQNKNFDIKLANVNMIGSDIQLSNLAVKNPAVSVVDSKNKVNVDTKNLNINLNKLNIKNNVVNIDNINVKEQKVSIKDRKNAMYITTNKTDINLSNLVVNNGITTIGTIKTKAPALYLNNAKTKMNIKALGTTLNVKDIKVEGTKTSVSSISLNNPTLDIKDKVGKTDINIKKTNVNINSLALNDGNVNINKIVVSKPTIKLSNKKNNNQITARDIKVTLNKLTQNKKGLKVSSIRLYEPALSIYNTKEKTKINARNVSVNVRSLQNSTRGLKIAKVDVNKPKLDIILPKKATTQEKKKEVAKKQKKKTTKNDSKLNIGPININNAVLSFEDKNLPLPFKTTITELNGKVSELNTSVASKTRLQVDGVVDKYGVAKITGIVDPNDVKLLTDITMLFKNISMQNFTPYTEKFVGRELNSGKLDLDLKYNIQKSDLDANNNIIITKIKFGKQVESKDAVSLPLELAIALLEDSNGVIDLNIPISGNVDDPKFSVGPIVWKAFSNLIMKAITAPFSLLGAIFGFAEDEIKSVSFDHAKSKITPTQKETLDKISQILVKRPNLAVKLNPTLVDRKDLEAMKKAKFDDYIKSKIPNDQIRNYESKYLSVLGSKYKKMDKNFDKTTMKFVKDGKLDKVAFTKFLEKKLIASEQVTKKDVLDLAHLRVKNIKTYLTKEKLIKENQIKLSDDLKVKEAHHKSAVIDLEISKAN